MRYCSCNYCQPRYHRNPDSVIKHIHNLARTEGSDAIPRIAVYASNHPDWKIRRAAIFALKEIGDPVGFPYIADGIEALLGADIEPSYIPGVIIDMAETMRTMVPKINNIQNLDRATLLIDIIRNSMNSVPGLNKSGRSQLHSAWNILNSIDIGSYASGLRARRPDLSDETSVAWSDSEEFDPTVERFRRLILDDDDDDDEDEDPWDWYDEQRAERFRRLDLD